MLFTSSTAMPLQPAAAASAPVDLPAGSGDLPAGSGFQPVLAALTLQFETGPGAPSTALPEAPATPLPVVEVAAGDGNGLPPGGEALPMAGPELPTTEVAALSEPALPATPSTAPLDQTSVQALAPAPALVSAPVSAPAPADAEEGGVEIDAETQPELEPGLLFAPVADTVVAAPVSAPVSAPVPTQPVAGAVKRMLPAGDKPPAGEAARAAVMEKPAASAPGVAAAIAAADIDPAGFDLDAAIDQLEVADTSPSGVPVGANRESAARQYQGLVTTQTQVDVPVGKPGWSSAVVDKLMWFSAQQVSNAELHLNPAELGPLSVRITTHQEQTTVYFTSHHASVRDAVDQALPRLREMFESQGMQLLDAGVGDQQARQHGARGEAATAQAGGQRSGGDDGDGSEGSLQQVAVRVPSGLVDFYA